jgi:predicted transcriptional regulator
MMVIYKDPVPTFASKSNVFEFAEQVASELDFNPGDPMESVVSHLGGAVSYRDSLGGEVPDAIRVEPDGKFEIFLSSLTSANRDRFTIAHELGHFFLHFPLVQEADPAWGMKATRWVDEQNPQLERCEWEANWFAAAFLMPEKLFRASLDYGGLDFAAGQFGVSEKAANIRAKSLNIQV